MMKFAYRKTTHGDVSGPSRISDTNFGNCYYKGTTVVWEVFEIATGEHVGAVYRKSDAIKWAEFLNAIDYDGHGCPMMMFERHLAEMEDWQTLDKMREV